MCLLGVDYVEIERYRYTHWNVYTCLLVAGLKKQISYIIYISTLHGISILFLASLLDRDRVCINVEQ